MEFIFTEPVECNLHMVREFYTNWVPEARSHYVTVRGRNVPITPTEMNIEAIVKSAMRKARVHKGHKYAFGGLITKICRAAEMLRHQNSSQVFTNLQLGEVERRYPLNDHAKALLGISPEFREPVNNDILTDEKHVSTNSDVTSDSNEEVDLDQAVGGDAMEDLSGRVFNLPLELF
ncbi:hypothetical protein H5410_042213 [Solanum commersonii]|uniref:Uncharacterized protein n=1 Tax=Solanum commersonii TaxID=4109 RepID=A0A9J5XTP7_SOLCO|nr:hypothetical protein H5410_042213 [Solanum commersonii]